MTAEKSEFRKNRDNFRNKTNSLFRNAGIRIYSELLWGDPEIQIYPKTGSWFGFYDRMFPVIAAVSLQDITRLHTELDRAGFENISLYKKPDFSVLFFKNNGLPGIVIAPHNDFISLDPLVLNQGRDARIIRQLQHNGEIAGTAGLQKIDFVSARILWVMENKVSAAQLRIPETDYLAVKYENTQKEFSRMHHLLADCPEEREKPDDAYDHIGTFSRIYFRSIQVITETIKGGGLVLHDIGSQFAHFPLLLNFLSAAKELLPDFKEIIASDISMIGEYFARQYLHSHNILQTVRFITVDVCGGSSGLSSKDFPESDVTTMIDVLEHLPDDASAFQALGKAWRKTGKLLIAHVPFEKKANPAWDHFITFSPEKLLKWAEQITDADDLSGYFHTPGGKIFRDYGFIILCRKEQPQ